MVLGIAINGGHIFYFYLFSATADQDNMELGKQV